MLEQSEIPDYVVVGGIIWLPGMLCWAWYYRQKPAAGKKKAKRERYREELVRLVSYEVSPDGRKFISWTVTFADGSCETVAPPDVEVWPLYFHRIEAAHIERWESFRVEVERFDESVRFTVGQEVQVDGQLAEERCEIVLLRVDTFVICSTTPNLPDPPLRDLREVPIAGVHEIPGTV